MLKRLGMIIITALVAAVAARHPTYAGGSGGGNGCAVDIKKYVGPPTGLYSYHHAFDNVPSGYEYDDVVGYRQKKHEWAEAGRVDAEIHPSAGGGCTID